MISAFAVIRNEEKYLQRMFDNLEGYVDEIVIVDQESEDKSVAICIENKAIILPRPCVGYCEADYEFAAKCCSYSWLLQICPDEVWDKEALAKMRDIGTQGPVAFKKTCHAFRRIEYTGDVKHEVNHPNYQLKLMPKWCAKFSDLIHTSFKGYDKIIHHELFIHHLKDKQDRLIDDNRFDTVYRMLLLKYGNSKIPWIMEWMESYRKQIKRYREGKPWVME